MKNQILDKKEEIIKISDHQHQEDFQRNNSIESFKNSGNFSKNFFKQSKIPQIDTQRTNDETKNTRIDNKFEKTGKNIEANFSYYFNFIKSQSKFDPNINLNNLKNSKSEIFEPLKNLEKKKLGDNLSPRLKQISYIENSIKEMERKSINVSKQIDNLKGSKYKNNADIDNKGNYPNEVLEIENEGLKGEINILKQELEKYRHMNSCYENELGNAKILKYFFWGNQPRIFQRIRKIE